MKPDGAQAPRRGRQEPRAADGHAAAGTAPPARPRPPRLAHAARYARAASPQAPKGKKVAAAPAAVKKAAAPAKPVNPLYEKRPKTFSATARDNPASGTDLSVAGCRCGRRSAGRNGRASRWS